MPSLPIPIICAAVLAYLLVQMVLRDRRWSLLAMLLAVCTAQSLIIALAQHYHVPGFRFVQPITATLIPPLAWLAFQSGTTRPADLRDGWHAIGPLNAVVFLAAAPYGLDVLIPAMFFGYGAAILWVCRTGADAFSRLPLGAVQVPLRAWQIIGFALVVSAFSDGLIIAAIVADMAHLKPWISSVVSAVTLLTIGALGLHSNVQPGPDVPPVPQTANAEDDAEIMAKLETVMAADQPYLNPDLTLTQLSRRVLVPAKQLSGAINRATGGNVSKYINAARIRAAQDMLMRGESVTSAMLGAGFYTKSNFNREFLRITGQSPSAWTNAKRAD